MSTIDSVCRSLVIASGNQGKLREFKQLLNHLPVDLWPQPEELRVEETGNTFAQNARLKAIAAALYTGQWSLADDSGLSVVSLDGAPGVHSARFAPTDSERVDRLLELLVDVQDRRASFNAALCVVSSDGRVLLEVEGSCEGVITHMPRGKAGFGYDPIFEVKGTGLTFAEMSSEQKKQYGHRGIAFGLLEPKLSKLLSKIE